MLRLVDFTVSDQISLRQNLNQRIETMYLFPMNNTQGKNKNFCSVRRLQQSDFGLLHWLLRY